MQLPASRHSASAINEAYEWLHHEAAKDGALPHAGVALDELRALAFDDEPSQVIAWAIADTDGGRHLPRPLLRHLYPSREGALRARDYCGFQPEYYPIIKTVVSWRAQESGDQPE